MIACMNRAFAWYAAHNRWSAVAPALLSLLLLLPNLGETYLWTDEADTASIARNVLKSGLPLVYDGRNLIQYYPPVHNDSYVAVATPPLSIYLTAASFALFGISNATARFPFAVLGVIALLFLPSVIRRLTDDPWTRMVTPLALATSVPFLLYFRQCRYYAPMILATLWLVWAYLRLIQTDEKRTRSAVHATAAAVVLFHCHYFVCLGTLLGLGAHWLLAGRPRISWKSIVGMASGFAAFTVPWVVYGLTTTMATYSARSHISELTIRSFIHRFAHFLAQQFAGGTEDFAPPLLGILFIWLMVSRRHTGWRLLGWVSCACAMVVVLNVPGTIYILTACIGLITIGLGIRYLRGTLNMTPFSLIWVLPGVLIVTLTLVSETDQVRYLMGVVPFVYIGLIGLFGNLRHRFPRLSVLLLLAFLYTNVFRAMPAFALSYLPVSASQLGATLAESDWSSRLGVPRFLPEGQLWYHRMAVIDGAIKQRAPVNSYLYEYVYELTHDYDGPLEGIVQYLSRYGSPQDTVKIDSDAVGLIFYLDRTVLPEHLFTRKDVHADWVILRYSNWHGIPESFMDDVRERYDRIELPYPDMPWENRPEISYHNFRLPDRDWPRVVIYRYRHSESEPAKKEE